LQFRFYLVKKMELNRKKIIYLVILIIAIGVFLRSFNFSNWLHFELDQARDSLVISKAYTGGPGELPLLGPKARGTFLRLGPLFYYLGYASALVFGNTPPGMAMIILFLSILSLPLFFLFCNRFFDKFSSLLLLLVYSVSLFFIVYSRFSWNPNSLPFFIILLFYSLLKLSDSEEKKRGLWLIAAALSLSFATQLHILALFALPIVTFLYLIYKRPRIKIKFWIISLLVIVFLYSPVIINEYKTGGDNAHELIKAISGKSSKSQNSLKQRIAVDYFEHARNYFLSVSALNPSSFLTNGPNGETRVFIEQNKYCKNVCWNDRLLSLISVSLFTFGLVLLTMMIKKEEDKSKKEFLILCGLWFLITFFIFWPLASDLSPRFFLLSFPLSFVLFGLILHFLSRQPSRPMKYAAYLLVILAVLSNLSEINKRFGQIAEALQKPGKVASDPFLKESARVTYAQERKIIEYMKSFRNRNDYPVYYFSEPQYLPAFEYLLRQENFRSSTLGYRNIYEKGNYFYVVFSDPDENWDIGKYASKYDIIGNSSFGTLTVLNLKPRSESITGSLEDFSSKTSDKKANSRAPKRYIWNEITSGFSNDQNDDEENNSEGRL
jgi:hypothetical protein